MTNEVMNKAMDNLLDKRASTDEFNRMYYNGEQTDKTLNFVEKIEELFVLIRENREYQANILNSYDQEDWEIETEAWYFQDKPEVVADVFTF